MNPSGSLFYCSFVHLVVLVVVQELLVQPLAWSHPVEMPASTP